MFNKSKENEHLKIENKILNDEIKELRKKLKNKGRMFQLMIENVDNSSFELVAPELICELDAD